MMYPLVVELAAVEIAAERTCGVLSVSPQAFYRSKPA